MKQEYQDIKFSDMVVDNAYQRPVDENRVRRIVNEFKESRVNPVKVSKRADGKYYIWDGQHTAMACAIHSNIKKHGIYAPDKDAYIKCIVYYGMTQKDEAMLFAEQDKGSRSVTVDQKFKARYIAGDVDVINFRELIESLGVTCDFRNHGGTKANTVSCYQSCYVIYKRDEKRLKHILTIIRNVWGNDENAYRKEIICGLDIFLTTYAGKYKEEILQSKLSKVSPLQIVRDAKIITSAKGDKKYAMVIFQAYNRGIRNGKLDFQFS